MTGGAVLFGRSFFTAYQPVLDPSGKTIGLLFVGMPMETTIACCRRRCAA